MKKLQEKVWMSDETSTAEEMLEILKLAKELGYKVLPETYINWGAFCYIIPGHVFTRCEKDYNDMGTKLVTHQQMLEIFANNEEYRLVVYKTLGKIRSLERLHEVSKPIEESIDKINSLGFDLGNSFFNKRETPKDIIQKLANDAIGQPIEFTKDKGKTIREAIDQLHEVCKQHGITVKNLTFEMI